MFEIVTAGGIVMVPIILCSILAVAITLERLWTLREQRVVPAELTDKVWQWVENRALSDKQIAGAAAALAARSACWRPGSPTATATARS